MLAITGAISTVSTPTKMSSGLPQILVEVHLGVSGSESFGANTMAILKFRVRALQGLGN